MSQKPSWGITIRTIVFSVLIGGASGVLATALTTNYLSNYAMELGELTSPLRLSQERPQVFPASYEDALSTVRDRVFPATVRIYPSAPQFSATGYTSEDIIANGVVLTSDGWIMVATEDAASVNTSMQVEVERDLYPIEQVVRDPVTGVVFMKTQASDLPVLAFGQGLDLQAGDQLFTFPFRHAIHATSVQHLDAKQGRVRSGDAPQRRLVLSTIQSLNPGTPVTNVSGELVGVTTGTQGENVEVLPLETVLPSFRSLLSDGEIVRSWIGVDVVNLHAYTGPDEELRDQSNGALIFGEDGVTVDSPADVAGLREGDIVLAVDGQALNGQHTLDELLMRYAPGDTVSLQINREGEEHEVSVQLDQHPALNLET